MDAAVHAWAAEVASDDPRIRTVGYFGSYAVGRWGVGSDVDLVVVVSKSDVAFERRPLDYDTLHLPVPADLLVYTVDEWERMTIEGGLPKIVSPHVVWVYRR